MAAHSVLIEQRVRDLHEQDKDEDKTMKTFIRRSIASTALLGNAALIAMLALSSTILVSHA